MDSICGGTLGKIANGQAVDVILFSFVLTLPVMVLKVCDRIEEEN